MEAVERNLAEITDNIAIKMIKDGTWNKEAYFTQFNPQFIRSYLQNSKKPWENDFQKARNNLWVRTVERLVPTKFHEFKPERQRLLKMLFEAIKQSESHSNKALLNLMIENGATDLKPHEFDKLVKILKDLGVIRSISRPCLPRILEVLKEKLD
jgi:hypothetical protein